MASFSPAIVLDSNEAAATSIQTQDIPDLASDLLSSERQKPSWPIGIKKPGAIWLRDTIDEAKLNFICCSVSKNQTQPL